MIRRNGLIVRCALAAVAAWSAFVLGSARLEAEQAGDLRAPPFAHGARAIAVIDADSGALLYADRAFEELPPASLTKMVTALVALERGTLEQRIEPARDYGVVPVVIGIGAGDSLRLEDALYGLLLNSGNDAAMAIAEAVGGGSVSRFVGWMNELVRGLGLRHTVFHNPHGLDEDGHVSSAYDMAIIGRTVMRHPVLARIVAERRRLVEGPPRWLFTNTNPLLGSYVGADGIKTGFEDLAGRCLAATAVRDGRRAVAVVLNSPRYTADAARLLDAAFADGSWGRPQLSAERDVLRAGMLRADLADWTGDHPRSLRAVPRATEGG